MKKLILLTMLAILIFSGKIVVADSDDWSSIAEESAKGTAEAASYGAEVGTANTQNSSNDGGGSSIVGSLAG